MYYSYRGITMFSIRIATYDLYQLLRITLLVVGLKTESLDKLQSIFIEELNVLFNITRLQKCSPPKNWKYPFILEQDWEEQG